MVRTNVKQIFLWQIELLIVTSFIHGFVLTTLPRSAWLIIETTLRALYHLDLDSQGMIMADLILVVQDHTRERRASGGACFYSKRTSPNAIGGGWESPLKRIGHSPVRYWDRRLLIFGCQLGKYGNLFQRLLDRSIQVLLVCLPFATLLS